MSRISFTDFLMYASLYEKVQADIAAARKGNAPHRAVIGTAITDILDVAGALVAKNNPMYADDVASLGKALSEAVAKWVASSDANNASPGASELPANPPASNAPGV
jgi:hypothetical protein